MTAATEKQWQTTVEELAETLGWATCHTFPLRTKHGWRTATTAKGWPDLVALRGELIIAAELKVGNAKARPEQLEWLERFASLGCGRAWLVRLPGDFEQLGNWLARPEGAPRRFGFGPEPG